MPQTREDLLDTVKRLIALGSSPNEHEAKMATARAAAMMAQHNLSLLEVEAAEGKSSRDWVQEHVWEAGRLPRETVMVASIVKKFFFVDAIRSREENGRYTMSLFGDRSNVLVARQVYVFLIRTFRGLAERNRVPRDERSVYMLGLARGVREVLQEQRERDFPAEKSQALVAINTELEEACQKHFKGALAEYTPKPAYGSRAWLEKGKEDGRKIQLHKGLEGQATRQLK